MELFLAFAFNRFLDTNFVVKNLDGSNLELQKENSSGRLCSKNAGDRKLNRSLLGNFFLRTETALLTGSKRAVP